MKISAETNKFFTYLILEIYQKISKQDREDLIQILRESEKKIGESVKNTPELVGTSEIAVLARVSKQSVCLWVRRNKTFPAPLASLKCGMVFDQREVETWLKVNNRWRPPEEKV